MLGQRVRPAGQVGQREVGRVLRGQGLGPLARGGAEAGRAGATREVDGVASPLLEINISGAQGILFNITGGSNLTLWEVTEAAEEIRAAADPEANIIFGTSFNERLGEEVMITVIATGFDGRRRPDAAHTTTGERVASTTNVRSSSAVAAGAAGTPVPARDYLDDLERQRSEIDETGAREETAVPVRPERSVGETKKAATYDAEDLEIPSFLRRR